MLKFANKSLPDYVKVTDLKYTILPSIETKTEKVYGRAGSYDFGVELGEREIEVDVMLIADSQHDIIKKARDFSTWLFYKDLQPLIILDEPDKQYMARISGDTEVSELWRTGTATIKFLCPSPYAESLTEKVVNYTPEDYTPVSVRNSGTVETYPIIDMEMKQDATSIAFIMEDKYVKIGSDDVVGMTQVDTQPLVLNDPMDTYSGWGTGIGIDGANAAIAGALSSNGYAIVQTGKDYGSATGWHGGAGVKTLSRELQDFQVTARCKLDSTAIKQVGRVEVYLFDVNNVIIGKVAIVDNQTTGEYPKVEARAGERYTGTYFVKSYGSKKGVYANFDGVIQISRIGRTWSAYFAKVDSKGKHNTRLTQTWYDTKNQWSTKKLAKIQVHIGAYGETEPVSTMYLSDLKVYEKNISVDSETQVPITFKAGDTVTIDNQRAIVLRNGEPIFSELDPASEFFPLEVDENGLVLSPPVADVQIRFKERWL
ncbi:phage tail family protein [Bacillus licheniformis]|uniref:distal tail protein Dit n=1 Tax=Bacillus licheniformis TaxID=1402 RepID=UPI00237C9280|nr:distal tail protein Dit [Bacillus licheniformis]MDE1381172.1 phage tail family protein [Bacillus licheniformis]